MSSSSPLFSPLQVGELTLPNRVVMAPLTRCRSGAERIPNDLMKEYYVQRAGAGLIISEATAVDPIGVGYVDTPGIWNAEQVAGWRKITDAVHEVGGRIVLQLWNVGRISHPEFLDGRLPIAPSAIAPEGVLRTPSGDKQPYVTPRALELDEIPGVVATYKRGAQNALEAGFDGVEIHGANGYLLDQFLRDGANQRTDEYGGSLENRARFMLEVTDAVLEVWPASRVGMHLSPRNSEYHSMHDSDTLATFSYVARELGKRRLAFICARESLALSADSRVSATSELRHGPTLKREFQEAGGGAYIGNESFDKASAEAAIQAGEVDAVAWGQWFLANPDLPRRFELDAPLNTPDMSTFYAFGPEGYVDYPFLNEK